MDIDNLKPLRGPKVKDLFDILTDMGQGLVVVNKHGKKLRNYAVKLEPAPNGTSKLVLMFEEL